MKSLLIIAAILIGGCASSGAPIKQSELSGFVKGETTHDQVISSLGKPQSVTANADGTKTLVYVHVNTKVSAATYIPIVGAFAGGATSNAKTLTVHINANNTVKDWSFTETETRYNN